jgi:hypothetical protein
MAFRLCVLLLLCGLWLVLPAADPVTIMPLGDSITQGNKTQDSYRRPLFHKLKDAGYSFRFVGSEKSNFTGAPPHPDFQQDNEGHYGWKITDVLPKLDGWLGQNNPDIVLLHLGTNDNGQPNRTPDAILADIESMIDIMRKHNPKVKVLLAQLMTNWGDLVVHRGALHRLPRCRFGARGLPHRSAHRRFHGRQQRRPVEGGDGQDQLRGDAAEEEAAARCERGVCRGIVGRAASWMRHELAAQGAGGRVPMRRMNRVEYANTVRDLFSLEELRPAHREGTAGGRQGRRLRSRLGGPVHGRGPAGAIHGGGRSGAR